MPLTTRLLHSLQRDGLMRGTGTLLSGACTTEIASFDEFASLRSDDAEHFDHIVFDTVPTGHTLRLLSLPKAWSGFLDGNDRGASCLGPHSGLKMQEQRFKAALKALSDPALTTVVLVTRADKGAIVEAAHTSEELHELGLNNQRLAINGVFHASDRGDAVACAKEQLGVDMPPYRILGACNPPLAYKALQAVPEIGVLLPCNVIVREEGPDRGVVGFLDPQISVDPVDKPEAKTVADAAELRLRRACESLGGSPTGPT